ncbi:MAG: DUF418 domain-containing protein [Candidatus Eisenbacteria bacterium]|uniref:DUF418 domain-containing protein n=1 Tax=Eiseniibacteriota bacterium TaxID=2212470 RepID=A0A7Y2EBP8_UNCEI|nr:DUF418 domain-containing protein [Candidatus Eisenbacteria bacterium]
MTEFTPPEVTSRAKPVPRDDRVRGLDLLRGIAIYGILVVNIQIMFVPILFENYPAGIVPGERFGDLVWFLVRGLFEFKFITLFSMLFGVGFWIQWSKWKSKERSGFAKFYLWRLFLLLGFGVLHGTLLYFGDILTSYAVAGVGLLLLRSVEIKSRLFIAGGMAVGMSLLLFGLTQFDMGDRIEETETARETAAVLNDYRDTGQIVYGDSVVTLPLGKDEVVGTLLKLADISPPAEVAIVETVVFAQGPNRWTLVFRTSIYLLFTLSTLPFYVLWRALAAFLIGTVLAEMQIWNRAREDRFLQVSLALFIGGVVLALVAAYARYFGAYQSGLVAGLGYSLQDLSAYPMALGIGGLTMRWASGTAAQALREGLEAVGRTALSNYIGQSFVTMMIATSVGLGLYGTLTQLQLLALATGIFLAQIVLSVAWLKVFRFGLLEWVWRCLTYRTLLPLRR